MSVAAGPAPRSGDHGGELSEAELIADTRMGQTEAFGELVRRHQAIAYRTAAMIVGPSDAEDVAQEALVKAYRALPRFRAEAPFRPWLLAIVANEARNRRRSSRRYGGAVNRLAALSVVQVTDAGADPAERVMSSEGHSALVEAIKKLPEPDQLVIYSRYLLELSEAETAAALRCPVGTVKSRLSRALVRLRGVMEPPAEPPAEAGASR